MVEVAAGDGGVRQLGADGDVEAHLVVHPHLRWVEHHAESLGPDLDVVEETGVGGGVIAVGEGVDSGDEDAVLYGAENVDLFEEWDGVAAVSVPALGVGDDVLQDKIHDVLRVALEQGNC